LRSPLQITCLIFILLFSSCGSSGSLVQTDAQAATGSAQAEKGDYAPRQIEEAPAPQADAPIFWVAPPPFEKKAIDPSKFEQSNEPKDVNRPTEGYRIQVYSGRESATARRIFAQIRSITGLEAYLNYEAPQYKVRVGDFTSRDEANQLLQEIRSQGFPEAWIVRSTVSNTK